MLQIAFYGLGLNSSIILSAIGFGSPKKGLAPGAAVYQNLHNASLGNIILSMAGLVPGYWATFIFIDRWGRKPIQFMGFAVLTVLFLIMGTSSFPLCLCMSDSTYAPHWQDSRTSG